MTIIRKPHFWSIAALMVVISLGYYGEYAGISEWAPFGRGFFGSDYTHDVHRALFLIPMLYAAVVFHLRGAVIASAIAFCIVIPRGLFVSDYPDPLLRALIAMAIASLATVLLGQQRDRRQHLAAEIAERKLAENRIEHLNSVLRAIRNVNQLIVREQDRDRLLQDACKSLIETRGYHNIWIALVNDAHRLLTTAEAGLGAGFVPMIKKLEQGELTVCSHRALAQSEVVITNNPLLSCTDCPLAHSYSGRAAMTVQLKHCERVYGILSVSVPMEFIEDHEEQSLLQEVAGDLAFALYNMELEGERKLVGEELAERTYDLGKRVKELTFLYNMSNLLETQGISAEEIYSGIVNMIPSAWQFPEITCAKIILGDQEFQTVNYVETDWKQTEEISAGDKRIGTVEVCCREERSRSIGRPFFEEEARLLKVIAERLGHIVERKKAEKTLVENEARYRALFDFSSDGIIVRDLEGNIMMANESVSRLTGYPIHELRAMNVKQFLSDSSIDRIAEKQKALLVDKEQTSIERYELRLIRKDGTERIGEAVTSLLGQDGQSPHVLAIIRDVTEQRQQRDAMRAYTNQVTQAQEEERKRIARELHDETIQDLASLGMDIDSIARTERELSESIVEGLEGLRTKTDSILNGIRRFSQDLRPPMIDELGLTEALRWLVEDLGTNQSINTSLEIKGVARRFSPETELLLFRITQEALNNVKRHSKATEASLVVEFETNRVNMTVVDNGHGFELAEGINAFAQAGKLGLIGMQERARLLGGSLRIESRMGRGTTIAIELPV